MPAVSSVRAGSSTKLVSTLSRQALSVKPEQPQTLPKDFSLSLETYLELPGTYLVDASISSATKRVKPKMSPWTEALSNAAM